MAGLFRPLPQYPKIGYNPAVCGSPIATTDNTGSTPSTGPSKSNASLSISDLSPALEEVFDGEHERRWACEAWTALISKGFADYSNELQRCQSAINFIAFAEFYKDWREMSDGGERVFDYGDVPSSLNLSAFRVVQLIGCDRAFLDDPAFDAYGLDEEKELFSQALFRLELAVRPKILAALKEHYGGLSGFFVALWNSNRQPRPADYDEYREEYDHARDYAVSELNMWEPQYQEDDGEILNDVTDEKMHLWTGSIKGLIRWTDIECNQLRGNRSEQESR